MSYTCVHLLERFVHPVYIMFLVILAAKTNELKNQSRQPHFSKSGLKDSELKVYLNGLRNYLTNQSRRKENSYK